MSLNPTNWNIVIAGAWNPAILTPDGVSRRLFGNELGTPLELELAIDKPGQFRAKHEGIIVTPSGSQLQVSIDINDMVNLRAASRIAEIAITTLPETPLVAIGINIRYVLTNTPPTFIDLLESPLDDMLSDAGYASSMSSTTKTIDLEPGCINMVFRQTSDNSYIDFNFHLDRNDHRELNAWVNRTDEFVSKAQELLQLLNIQD
jgi:hypothetical protein